MPILFGGLFLFLIFNFIEMIGLKWCLAVMTGGAFFYSIYDDINLFIQKEIAKILKKINLSKKIKLTVDVDPLNFS